MITLQLKRTARFLSDTLINDFVPRVGEPFLVQYPVNSSGTFYTRDCTTTQSTVTKNIYLEEEDGSLFLLDNTVPGTVPKVGQTIIVKFNYANSVSSPKIKLVINGTLIVDTKDVAYKNGDTYVTSILSSVYNWNSGETRVFTFDGAYWIIQLPEDCLNSSLLFIGNGTDTVSTLYKNGTYIPVSKYISDDMIKNGSITITKLDPNIDLASKEALQEISNALDSFQTETGNNFDSVNSEISLNKIYHVVCDTVSSTANKVVTIPDMPIYDDLTKYDGITLVIKFVNSNTATNPKIETHTSINNTTIISAKPMYVGSNPLTGVFYWRNNDSVIFTYSAVDNRWYMDSTCASSIIASWCANNNTTFINGGMIYAGSVTADKIAAHSITAEQIAVGSLDSSVFTQSVSDVLSNLSEFKQQCGSAGTIVAKCESTDGIAFKDAEISVDNLQSISITNTGMPLVGTSMVVKFENENTYQGNVYFRVTATNGDVAYTKFSAQLGFKLGDSFINIGSSGVQDFSDAQLTAIDYYKWHAGEYRTVMFDGTYWILSITTEYLSKLAEWCLLNGQTWIGGGTIVTGTIVADQIQSGSIDTAKVSLVCMAPNDYGDIINYGGFSYFEGSTGSYITKGVRMYGAIDSDDPDGEPNYYVAITNRGIAIRIGSGMISGYGSEQDSIWSIDASGGVFIGARNDSGNVTLGKAGSTSVVSGNMSILGNLSAVNLPTSSTGLSSGQIYSDNGVLKIVT